MFNAVNAALNELKTDYLDFNAKGTGSRLPSPGLPDRDALDPGTLKMFDDCTALGFLEYDGRLPRDFSRAMFNGILDKKAVVIKFCSRYGEEAHKVLAELGLAPELHFCIDICGGLKMVVMELLVKPWKTLAAAYQKAAIPEATRTAIGHALDRLHNAGFVFGDLRRPNVFVDTKTPTNIKLVDFEFAGTNVWYPMGLNTSGDVPWAAGIQPGGPITKEHDLAMCKQL